jgi:MoaA/NifB/PqqE/SkfB family radical SAM enzyme
MKSVKGRWNHQDTIKIEWNLGKRCNLDCAYCPEYIHDNHSAHTDIEVLKRTVAVLNALDKPVRLSLTGGEPSVHPRIEELLEAINVSQNITWLSMTTNATRPARWYASQQHVVDQYVFSLHFEKDWEKLLDNILNYEMLRTNRVLVHIMAHHKYMEPVKSAKYNFQLIEIPYVIRRIRWTEGNHDLFDDMRYHPDDLAWIKEATATVDPNCIVDGEARIHANDIIKLKMNDFRGWTCNAGLESLMINWDGEVYRATCRVGDSLGNIYNGNFNIPTKPIICTRNWCTCEADIPLTKEDARDPEISP